MVITPENSNSKPLDAMFPLSFQNFVIQNLIELANYAYEQQVTRQRYMIVASYQCLEAASIDFNSDGEVHSINQGIWRTRLSHIDLPGYKQHLVNSYGELEAIESHIAAANRILDLINPEQQCLLYLQQGIFLPELDFYCNDERIISDVVDFPVTLSDWYKSTNVTATNRKLLTQLELELELFKWLQIHGVEVERQVATKNNHRLDLQLLCRMMLELKAGKVTGDDVCQAIDYHATYQRPWKRLNRQLMSKCQRQSIWLLNTSTYNWAHLISDCQGVDASYHCCVPNCSGN